MSLGSNRSGPASAGRVLLLSVTLAVVAGATAGAIVSVSLRGGSERNAGRRADPEAREPDRAIAPLRAEIERNTEAIARIQESLGRMRRALVEGGIEGVVVRDKKPALASLVGIKQGERQLALKQSLKELVAFGDEIVLDIVALLKSGQDQDYGRGFSISGNTVGAYPRLRTVLIDVLRQIGTRAAKRGLLDAMRESNDPLDHRDLLMLYRTTRDEEMVAGIRELIPRVIDGVKRLEGREARAQRRPITSWLREHGVEGSTALLGELVVSSFDGRWADLDAFGLLATVDPERAARVAREAREADGKEGRTWLSLTYALGWGRDVPLASVARFYELVFGSLELSDLERGRVYLGLPGSLRQNITSLEERARDGAAMVDFLRKRIAAETDQSVRIALERKMSNLAKEIEKLRAR